MILTTNYAAVIRPLQLIVLAVAGLFVLRVMRVAVVTVRPARDKGQKRQKNKRTRFLALEIIEPDAHAGKRIEVDRMVSFGRGVECDVVIDDTYLSTRHAQFSNDDGDLLVEDLGSTNGTYVNQELIKHRTRLERSDIVQCGGVLFEVVR